MKTVFKRNFFILLSLSIATSPIFAQPIESEKKQQPSYLEESVIGAISTVVAIGSVLWCLCGKASSSEPTTRVAMATLKSQSHRRESASNNGKRPRHDAQSPVFGFGKSDTIVRPTRGAGADIHQALQTLRSPETEDWLLAEEDPTVEFTQIQAAAAILALELAHLQQQLAHTGEIALFFRQVSDFDIQNGDPETFISLITSLVLLVQRDLIDYEGMIVGKVLSAALTLAQAIDNMSRSISRFQSTASLSEELIKSCEAAALIQRALEEERSDAQNEKECKDRSIE